MGVNRRGFTIIEVILALTLGATILLNARLLSNQVDGALHRIDQSVAAINREANGLRLARRLVMNAYQPADSVDWFRGSQESAEMATWCATVTGTWTRCHVAIWIGHGASASMLYVRDTVPGAVLAASLSGDGKLWYIARDASGADHVLPMWDRDDLPRALVFASLRDTVTFPLALR